MDISGLAEKFPHLTDYKIIYRICLFTVYTRDSETIFTISEAGPVLW